MMVKGELKSKKEHKREVFRTFSLSQMSNVELARTLPWRENALFEEREKNVFVKPNEHVELARTLPWRENALLGEQEKNNFPKELSFTIKHYVRQHRLLF